MLVRVKVVGSHPLLANQIGEDILFPIDRANFYSDLGVMVILDDSETPEKGGIKETAVAKRGKK